LTMKPLFALCAGNCKENEYCGLSELPLFYGAGPLGGTNHYTGSNFMTSCTASAGEEIDSPPPLPRSDNRIVYGAKLPIMPMFANIILEKVTVQSGKESIACKCFPKHTQLSGDPCYSSAACGTGLKCKFDDAPDAWWRTQGVCIPQELIAAYGHDTSVVHRSQILEPLEDLMTGKDMVYGEEYYCVNGFNSEGEFFNPPKYRCYQPETFHQTEPYSMNVYDAFRDPFSSEVTKIRYSTVPRMTYVRACFGGERESNVCRKCGEENACTDNYDCSTNGKCLTFKR